MKERWSEKEMSKKRCVILGLVCSVLWVAAVCLVGVIDSHYSPGFWWKFIFGLDAFFGIGGFCFSLVFFGKLLE